MAMDFERIKVSLDAFHAADANIQQVYAACVEQAVSQLREELPAINDADLAAVSYYIASLLSALRNIPVRTAGDIITDTAVGYSLGAAQLLGMLPA